MLPSLNKSPRPRNSASFAFINDASTAELQEMVAAAATMSAEEIADVTGNLSGAAKVAGSALVAAALAAVASL